MSMPVVFRSLDATAWTSIVLSLMMAVWVFSGNGPDFPKPPEGVSEITSVVHLSGRPSTTSNATEKALGLPLVFPAKDYLQGPERFEIRSPDLAHDGQSGVCITRFSTSGELLFNELLIGTPSTSARGVVHNAWNAHFAALPFAEKGLLTLDIVAVAGRPLGLWPIWVGPVEKVRQACQRLHLKRRLVSGGIALVMLSFGLMTIAQSRRQRDDAAVWFGVTAVFACAKPFYAVVIDPPVSDELWTLLYYCTRLLYIPIVYVFIFKLIDSPQKKKFGLAGLLLHCVFAVLFVISPPSVWLTIFRVQGALYITLGLLVVWEILQFQRQKITQADITITWLFIVSIVMHCLDYFLLLIDGEMHYSSISLTAFPVIFVPVVLLLIEKSSIRLAIAEESARLLGLQARSQASEISAANKELASARDDALVAAERRKIVREMHDGVGSHLVGAVSFLSQNTENSKAREMVEHALFEMRSAVDATEADGTALETLLGSLRHRIDPALSEQGIALEWVVGQFNKAVEALDNEMRLNLLRVCQEAFANVLRHSKATRVCFEAMSSEKLLTLTITDNGLGFDKKTTQQGKGLRNLSFRADQLGASLTVSSSPQGTMIQLKLPLP